MTRTSTAIVFLTVERLCVLVYPSSIDLSSRTLGCLDALGTEDWAELEEAAALDVDQLAALLDDLPDEGPAA